MHVRLSENRRRRRSRVYERFEKECRRMIYEQQPVLKAQGSEPGILCCENSVGCGGKEINA